MDATTQGAPAAPSGVQSPQTGPEAGSVEAFDNLWDAIERSEDPEGRPLPPEAPDVDEEAEDRKLRGQDQPQGEEGDEPAPDEKAQAKPDEKEPEGKEFDSLEHYLQESKIEPESFMALPVTVKVDGKESQVPLAELVKGYQLSSASYNRMNELAQERTGFEKERTDVRQALGLQIQRTEALLKMAHDQLMGDLAQLTPEVMAQLRTENPGQYAAIQQDIASRRGAIGQVLQQVAEARRQQTQEAEQQRQASLPGEFQKLLSARPEWRDQAKRTAAQAAMNQLGKKLGFSDAELNGIYDHRYMLVLDMAARFAQLQASQSATVTRVRTAPRMAKPGTRTNTDPSRSAYQSAKDRAARNPHDEDAQAAVFDFLAR